MPAGGRIVTRRVDAVASPGLRVFPELRPGPVRRKRADPFPEFPGGPVVSRRTLSLALLVTAVALPALLADEPVRVTELYMLPPHSLNPSSRSESLPVVRREPVEAPRPSTLISYSPVEIQMQPVGAFDISCALQFVPESGVLNTVETVKVIPEPVTAPKPQPAPVTVIDPSVFSCSIQPLPGGTIEAAPVASGPVPVAGGTP
jgi:hypothetical protein